MIQKVGPTNIATAGWLMQNSMNRGSTISPPKDFAGDSVRRVSVRFAIPEQMQLKRLMDQTGSSFDGDLEAGFRQPGNDGGQRDAPLAGEAVPGDTDDRTTLWYSRVLPSGGAEIQIIVYESSKARLSSSTEDP